MSPDKNIDAVDPHRPVEHDLPLFNQNTNRDEQAKKMGQYAETFKPHKLARRTDPDTSRFAARSAGVLARRHEALILDCLNTHRRGTSEQIAKYISLSGYSIDGVKVSRRMKKLVLAGKIVNTGKTRLTVNNRPATVWMLVGQKDE